MISKKDKLISNIFTYPTLIIVLFVGFVPILYSVYMSLFKYEMISADQSFIGLQNFISLFYDERFVHAAVFTVGFALFATILELVLGFVIAYMLYSEGISKTYSAIMRVILLIPYMISPVVISYTFKTMIYDVNFGFLNALLKGIGIAPFNYFAGTINPAVSVLIMEVFLRTSFIILILYAGLSTIQPHLIEASMIDGAHAWKRIQKIIIPILKPVIFVAFIFRFMDALKMFDEMYVLTKGGPGYSTENLSLFVSSQGFEFSHMGRACAAAVLFFILVAIISGLLYKIFNRKKVGEGSL